MFTLLTHLNEIRYKNVYVYSKSLCQAKYLFLKQLFEPIEGIQYFAFSKNDEVIVPAVALSNSFMIFDDIAWEKQDSVRSFYCIGIHNKVNLFEPIRAYFLFGSKSNKTDSLRSL